MRSFFGAFFGTLAALAFLVLSVATIVTVLVTGYSGKREVPASVESGSWLILDLADQIQDAPLQSEGLQDFAEALRESGHRPLQTRQVIRALQAAAADDDIAGLLLAGQDPAFGRSTGFATLQEIRDAVVAFRVAGKPVKAFLSVADARDYYLASAAGEITLDPFGAILLPGLATQPTFYAGTFEKLGIGVQVTRVGKYKSAVEPFTRKDMSPESRAQTQKLLDDVWGQITRSIEGSRQLTNGSLQAAVDAEGMIQPASASKLGLVDRVAYIDEILEELRASTGTKNPKISFKQVSVGEYAALLPAGNLAARRKKAGDAAAEPAGAEKLAIVYAEGAIVDGSGAEQGVVWSRKVARDLREIRRNDDVKAVVLRVNSPGGSVTASEAIQRELRLIQKTRPVVVSMGNVAASGGYWISTYADRIFAEPTTITGSIGVFGLLFNVQDLATEKLGLSFETVKTGRFADAMSVTRPKTDEELALIQKNVDWVYDQFLSKVAESRRLERAALEEIAQGRVWSGTEALSLGLVDELGGLDSAVAFAAGKAAIGEEFAVLEYPRRRSFVEAIAEALERKGRDQTGSDALAALAIEAWESLAQLGQFNDPRGVYARLPFHLSLQ
ncbi:MAG: signal peptide peptidase SppA [Candidatus Binatia bacterium]